MPRAWIAIVLAATARAAAAAPTVVAYAHPAACFESTVTVHQMHDEDDGGYRANLTFTYRGKRETASVPTEVGEKLAPRTTYKLCATLIDTKPDAPPIVSVIEVWRGARLLWSETYDFPVTQTLAWTKDKALLVELGRAMDDVWATPFARGMKPIAVSVPAEVARAAGTGTRTIVLRIAERADGARIAVAAILDASTVLWHAP
jgi:hypothetical protein